MADANSEVIDNRLSIKQAAQGAGVCRKTINNWIEKGILPCTKTKSGRVRIKTEDLRAVLSLD